VKDLLKKIKRGGEYVGCRFVIQKTAGNNTYIVANLKAGKVILIGESEGERVKFYEVNVKKWKWADSEGFSADTMVSELFDEIFTEIKVSHPISSFDLNNEIINRLK
tara:strand:- start:121 stop:441 length:321 start_codon:yes stop_codon:yes gene_type:complete